LDEGEISKSLKEEKKELKPKKAAENKRKEERKENSY
jgi:hypothetical protein